MQMGQTLVFAGFAQSTQADTKSAAFFSLGRQARYARTLLVIAIEVENASPELWVEGEAMPRQPGRSLSRRTKHAPFALSTLLAARDPFGEALSRDAHNGIAAR